MTRTHPAAYLFGVALRLTGFLAVVAPWAVPPTTRASLAALAGGSGTSGVLSSNPTIRKQQLLCDPLNPSAGSYSVKYDPGLVSYDFGSLTPVTGYTITSAYISRDFGTPGAPKPQLVDINTTAFLDVPESGYIQVFFQENSGVGYQPPSTPPGYTIVDSRGVKGNETHFLTFSYLAGVPDTTTATYTVFADQGGRPLSSGGTSPADFLKDANGNTVSFNQIAPATVSGNLVPEPASLGVLALTATTLLRRRRAREVGIGR
jgi:hypothetical protein